MFGTKIEKHGVFFRKGRLRTECKCGCVYHTPKRKVCVRINYFNYMTDGEIYFETTCPECRHENRQLKKDLEAANA